MHPCSIPPGRSSWIQAPFLIGRRCWTEWKLKRQGHRFRDEDPCVSAFAYANMKDGEFEHINACQDWANWRTLPQLIRSIPVPGPWTVIDLGCGQGLSTEVLAWCCPPGSSLLGYDLSETALRVARQRVYRHPNGITENVRFVTQAIDQPWKSPDGSVIGDASATLINACGVVGHHLSESRFERVAAEIRRVLAPNGWALLDSGPKLGRQSLSRIMEANGLAHRSHVASWWFDRYGQSAFSFGAQ